MMKKNKLVANPATRKLAVEALERSTQNNPYNKIGRGNRGSYSSMEEWYDYSHDLISSIEQLR